jgi:uncharacterized protein (TIGR02118 family)
MAKLIGLFKRREAMTAAEFRDYYENQHAPLALGHLGHLFASYTRNYVAHEIDGEGTPVDHAFDVVTEIVFVDDAAMQRMFEMTTADPEVRAAISEDEAKFMDKAASRIVLVTDHTATE